jgi:hypothetical protein
LGILFIYRREEKEPKAMLIHTAEGKRSIDVDLVLCMDRHRDASELSPGNKLPALWYRRFLPTTSHLRLRREVPRGIQDIGQAKSGINQHGGKTMVRKLSLICNSLELFMHRIVLFAALVISTAPTIAQAEPATIEGSWSGSGTINSRGAVDQVHCRARYTMSSGNNFAVSSVCATENGRYDITGHVTSSGGNRYRGTVTSGNESGSILLFHRGNHLSVSVTSQRGSARLTLSRR